MAQTKTSEDYELVIEVAFSEGTYEPLIGLTDFTISRTKGTSTTEVPDADDPSAPHVTRRGTTAKDLSISGTGVWALDNAAKVSDWYHQDLTLPVQIRWVAVTARGSAGDPEIEQAEMKLTAMNSSRAKGQKVSAEITLELDGAHVVVAKAAV